MDVVTDLTSQCVSYITVVQEVYKQQLPSGHLMDANFSTIFLEIQNTDINIHKNVGVKKRIGELMWISESEMLEGNVPPDSALTQFFKICKELFAWLEKNNCQLSLYASAYEWRQFVRAVLYETREQRKPLVEILGYMPVQIIFCLGGKYYTATQQRMCQVWQPEQDYKLNPVLAGDKKEFENWWISKYENPVTTAKKNKGSLKKMANWLDKGIIKIGLKKGEDESATQTPTRAQIAMLLLPDDRLLLKYLLNEETPIPFENLFIDELGEIAKSRAKRKIIKCPGVLWEDSPDDQNIGDPYKRAQAMNLYGLAFSGGGIRSATFNLGVLQKLAEDGVLPRFDYVSTASGGGYLGSWLASWIKRNGSISNVSDRLNPKKSADPLADEVRPIRWLRMFSNYLAPNASIMSTDAWTSGITWLRNTLINQFLLLFLLCSVLSIIEGAYGMWVWLLERNYQVSNTAILITCIFLLFSGAVLAGIGMRTYDPNDKSKAIKIEKDGTLYKIITYWGVISALFVGTYLVSQSPTPISFTEKMETLYWPAGAAFFAFLLVSVVGKYTSGAKTPADKLKIQWYIFVSSVIAAAAGGILFCWGWKLFEYIYSVCGLVDYFNYRLAFIIAVPVVLEIISITVVIRMAIMGILFPDLRREWWGRIGALAHRFIFVWLLVASCSLVFPYYILALSHKIKLVSLPAAFGGWSVIIGYAVKLAFSSKTPGQTPDKSSLSAADLFVRFAPYLFALGFVLFGSIIMSYLYNYFYPGSNLQHNLWSHLFIGIALGLIIVLISMRVGVNEFSLHHFYRNRLVRAYLGATRRREDRDKTVNNFTDFDQEDDLPLAELSCDKKYYGPYPIINTTLNSTVVTDLDRQDRKGESFIFTPKYCGFDISRTRASAGSPTNNYEYGYRPTPDYAYPEVKGPSLGTAMTISGAAVSPNWGYHSSPATAFLLTIFNVRLGWWIGNPRTCAWQRSDPRLGIFYLLNDLIGKSDITSKYVYLSDGGHFDNMSIYELVRRRCKYILLGDAEEDENTICEGFANAIRRCRIDFGVEIDIKLNPITRKDPKTGFCNKHVVKGTIWYPGDGDEPSGTLVYIKTALTGDESVDIREYFLSNPAFPQQSTADQFFDESQFESYRKLGYESLDHLPEQFKPIVKLV